MKYFSVQFYQLWSVWGPFWGLPKKLQLPPPRNGGGADRDVYLREHLLEGLLR